VRHDCPVVDADTTWEFTRRGLAVPGVSVAYGYFAEGLTPGLHRGLPSRDLAFVISLDEPVETAESPEAWAQHRVTARGVIGAGLRTRPAYVHQPRRQCGLQLAVHPPAARSLFGVRAPPS
jgi:hypothetical protein